MKISADISHKSKDIIQKYIAAAFKDTSLDFYGIKTAKIKEIINIELPVIEVKDNIMDFVFLLEDNTYLHLEFQTVYNEDDLIRFCIYDCRLFARDKRKINSVIIYSSDGKNIKSQLDIGVVKYNPQIIKMSEYDGDSIYCKLENKLKNNVAFDDLDIINISFIPLMNSKRTKSETAVKSIKLAQGIKDKYKRYMCIAALFALSVKYLNEIEMNSFMEVFKMVDLYAILDKEFEEKYDKKYEKKYREEYEKKYREEYDKKYREEYEKKYREEYDKKYREKEIEFKEREKEIEKEAEKEIKKETAKKLLFKKFSINEIIEITGLDEKTILSLKKN